MKSPSHKPLLFWALIWLALLLSPPSFSQISNNSCQIPQPVQTQIGNSGYKACIPYDGLITRAVKRRFPRGFQKPKAWRAQIYQESACHINALSPAGAKGLAQIMDGTARDLTRWLGADFDPFSPVALDYGAYYQARQMKVFQRRRRNHEQSWALGLAAYNSGLGNVLKAQAACNNARLWEEIAPCQSLITGKKNAHETRQYVIRIKNHRRLMEIK